MPVINPKTRHPFRSSNGPLSIWTGFRHHHRHSRIIQLANGMDDRRMVAQQIYREAKFPGSSYRTSILPDLINASIVRRTMPLQ
jgi:hypothetical protein